MRHPAHGSAQHCADEHARPEDAAGVARRVTDRRGDHLQQREKYDELQYDLAAQHAVHLVVPDAEDLRDDVAEQSHRESTDHRLRPQ